MIRHPFVLAAVLCTVAACGEPPFPSTSELDHLNGLLKLRTPPPSPTNQYADDEAAAALGQSLFHDASLSSCDAVACSNCHPMPTLASTQELNGGCFGRTTRNAPTLWNAAFRRWFYWDGQKDSLWAHAELPLTRDSEMASTPAELQGKLQMKYAAPYAAIFGGEPSGHSPDRVVANFGKAMEAYLRTLVRVDAPFDDELALFIRAAKQDIAANEERRVRESPLFLGLRTFIRKGRCIACHKGPFLTDETFHNLGVDTHGQVDRGRAEGIERVRGDLFNAAGEFSDDPERGRIKLEGIDSDLPPEGAEGAFKTPTLRNVALSAPYMHTGKLATLDEVIEFYDRGGDPEGTFAGKRAETIIPLNLTDEEKQALRELLESLTGREPTL